MIENLEPMRLSDVEFDFFRCKSCTRLITLLEERLAVSDKSPHPGQVCECGGMKYSPSFPRGTPPTASLSPAYGRGQAEAEAKEEFDKAFESATDEWLQENVRHFAWLRYMGEA